MDNWKEREMRAMERGGNKRFKAFLEEEMIEGELDYKSDVLQRYKVDLLREVSKEFGTKQQEKEPEKEEKSGEKKEEVKEIKKDNEVEEVKERKVSLTINEEDMEKEKNTAKPLEEQQTKVVMAEPKQKSGNSESTVGRKGKKKGKNKKFRGKRIEKVNLDQLVTDDLKVKTKSKIQKKQLFKEVKEDIPEDEEESIAEDKLPGSQIKKSKNNFLPPQKLETKLKTSKIKKYSGFGSDNLEGESETGQRTEVEGPSSKGFGVYGGYGSDDLRPKRPERVDANNGSQQGRN
jgi:hypothetical protein